MIKQILTPTYYIGICDKCGKEFKGHFRYNPDGTYREQNTVVQNVMQKLKLLLALINILLILLAGKLLV